MSERDNGCNVSDALSHMVPISLCVYVHMRVHTSVCLCASDGHCCFVFSSDVTLNLFRLQKSDVLHSDGRLLYTSHCVTKEFLNH